MVESRKRMAPASLSAEFALIVSELGSAQAMFYRLMMATDSADACLSYDRMTNRYLAAIQTFATPHSTISIINEDAERAKEPQGFAKIEAAIARPCDSTPEALRRESLERFAAKDPDPAA